MSRVFIAMDAGRWNVSARLLLGMIFIPCLPILTGCQSFGTPSGLTNSQPPLAQRLFQGNDSLEKIPARSIGQFLSRRTRAKQTDSDEQIRLARLEQGRGNNQTAMLHLQKAKEASPKSPLLLVEIGELHLASGHWLAANRHVDLAMHQDPHFAPAWHLKGKTELAKGDLSQALADFQRAASIDPDSENYQLSIVETYQRMNQPLRSLSAVEQLLSKYPLVEQPESAVIAKSIALMQLEQNNQAVAILAEASQRPNASSDVFLRLGQAQLQSGQVSQARLTFRRAKTQFPDKAQFDSLLSELPTAESRVALAD